MHPPGNHRFASRPRPARRTALWLVCCLVGLLSGGPPTVAMADAPVVTITNLAQLQTALETQPHLMANMKLDAWVCAASRPELGALVVRDATGVELLQWQHLTTSFQPGDAIHVRAQPAWFRQRDTGVEISAVPLVDNDGMHGLAEASGAVTLAAGRHPFQLDWFNGDFAPGLALTVAGPQLPLQPVPPTAWWQAEGPDTNQQPGLLARLYEGNWKSVPDFNWLEPVKTVTVTNLGLELYPQRDRVGVRFTGSFAAPVAGTYAFHLRSANGALLFLANPEPQVQLLGHAAPPPAAAARAGELMPRATEGRWVAMTGRVDFMTKIGAGLEFELRSGNGTMQVRLVDARGLTSAGLFHARIRARGLGRGMASLETNLILGRLVVAGPQDLEILEPAPQLTAPPPLLTTAEQVQLLRPEDAARHLPVRIRGVVTSAFGSLTLQDDTRGVYVDMRGMTNHPLPGAGEVWEVAGQAHPGDFAPIIVPETLKFLGNGQLPAPAHPSWHQLINGSMDVQWVEIQGAITQVSSNQASLLMPEGRLRVWFEAQNQSLLPAALNCQVAIRGVLMATWDVKTHEIIPGQIFLRNTRINLIRPAPPDVFDAPLKSPRDLLRFDLQAASFPRIKMRGVVVFAQPHELFLNDETSGLRILPLEPAPVQPGDLVEAVGYPEIGGASPILHEAALRKLGTGPLPAAKVVGAEDLVGGGLDTMRIQIAAVLVNQRVERAGLVLEMQAGLRPFLARIPGQAALLPALRTGSLLEMTGVYAGLRPAGEPGRGLDSFELWLAAPGAIQILKQPPWWSLKRWLALVGALSLLLSLVALWVFQLRRQVSLQTKIIREKAEREATLEERTRIARELHDTLEQALAGISLQLRALTDSWREMPAKPAQILKTTRQMVRHGQDEARRTVRNLRTLALETGGLPAALAALAREVEAGLAVQIEFKVDGTPVPLASQVENHLLRVGQEATTNVLKHARAKTVQIHLRFEPQAVRLVVQDDGSGFDVAHTAPSSAGHFGLLGMRERAEKMNGILTITSVPDRGTTVEVVVPLPGPRAEVQSKHEAAH